MQPLRLIIARSAEQFAAAERLRSQVYGEEERMLSDREGIGARHVDERDFADTTAVFLAYSGDDALGTVRLAVARTTRGRGDRSHGFELEAKLALRGFGEREMALAEVSRFCVRRKYRGTRVTPALFAALTAESLRRGVTHWVAVANMATDCAEDAAIAYRLLEGKRWLCTDFHAEAHSVESPPAVATRPAYTDEQRGCARRGDLAGLRLPRTLSLFASKMGARYIGAPLYDRHFNVFAAPLVVDLARRATLERARPPVLVSLPVHGHVPLAAP